MTVTWHEPGEEPRDGNYVAHARRVGEEKSLCGQKVMLPARMRPPFFESRCEVCENLRAGDEEMFPNHMKRPPLKVPE